MSENSKIERPILMSGAMVRACLREVNPKTQTRRVAKELADNNPKLEYRVRESDGEVEMREGKGNWYILARRTVCPYGKPGDRLWVRETHYRWGHWTKNGKTDKGAQRWKFVALDKRVVFAATDSSKESPTHRGDDGWWKRPGIFLPKKLARITLEIVKVRVERVQDISEADALAEGINKVEGTEGANWSKGQFGYTGFHTGYFHVPMMNGFCCCNTGRNRLLPAVCAYRELWDSINSKRDGGKFAWNKNPWVWVIEFKKVTTPAR